MRKRTIYSGIALLLLSCMTLTGQSMQAVAGKIKAQNLVNKTGYSDNFTTNALITNWRSNTYYGITWDATNKWLNMQMTSATYQRNSVTFKDAALTPFFVDMTAAPYIRFKAYANKAVPNTIFRLTDKNGKTNNSWRNNPMSTFDLAGGKWENFFIDFTGKLIYDDGTLATIDLANVAGLYYAMNDGVSDALINIDDFRVGTEAFLNKKPTSSDIPKPAYILTSAGIQTAQLTGIDDGNPERVENITITASSSDQTVVADKDIQLTYTGGTTATINYKPAGGNGVTTISLKIMDDHGTAYPTEEDTKVVNIVVEVRDPAVNNKPVCNNILSKVYSGRGQQILILPGVDDGDDNKTQNISISAISKDLTKLTIDSVVYKSPNQVAFIYIKEHQILGPVDIEVTIKDDGGVLNGGQDTYVSKQTIYVTGFKNPCANFVQYDVQQWQPRPTEKDIPTTNSLVKICQTNTPIETFQRDMFWAKMYGYIVPTITDYYMFQGFSNEGFYLYINLDDGVSTDPTKLTTICENEPNTFISQSKLLEAGKVYYFEAYARDIVNTFPFWLKWTSANVPLDFISNDNLSPDFDIIKPSIPANFKLSNLGVNDITLSWNASTDNKGVAGYNIFVNGTQANSSLITTTNYQIKGLNKMTPYSCSVVAVDYSDNASLPSQIINTTTYDVDLIPPSTPTNLKPEFVAAFGVKLHWNPATDGQTKVRGYNIYQDDVLINQNVPDTTLLINSLIEKTNYKFTVSAVDANYNESPQSAPYFTKTIAFDPNETRDGILKGRLSINLKPICKFEGFGLNVDYGRTSMISSNKVTYGGFESSLFTTTTDVAVFQKAVSNGSFSRTTVDPYAGKYSGQFNGLKGGYFRCNIGTQIDKRYTYLVRFAIKKHIAYTGDVQVKMNGSFSGSFPAQTITPTTDWKQYELVLNTTYTGAEGSWYLDFVTLNAGEIYLDNIEFIVKDFYIPGSPFSTKAMDLLKEFKPASVRWGGIGANSESFKYDSGIGSEATLSYANWVDMANQLKSKAFFSTGVANVTDFKYDPQTFKTFIEYMSGDASTKGGALRTSEGYTDLMSKSKGVLIELGNEVWGAAAHNAEIGADYTAYGAWVRQSANLMKATPGYNKDKMLISYSGRAPGANYGLHKSMLTGDTGEVDLLSISGYMGGNLNLDPNIPIGKTQLDYHKSSFSMMQNNFNGLANDWKEMLSYTGRILPMYMYEGNMTQNSYFGRLGQAVTFADYYSSMPLYGVPNVCVFALQGGQWGLINNSIDFKKSPLFYVSQYINNYCTGTLLESKFTTASKIYDGATPLTIDPVGCKAYTDSTSYSVAMFSRDFENDYRVQVDIPDNVGNGATCKLITIHGDSYASEDVLIDEKNITDFKDSILVTVPKYGVCILRFDGIDQHFTAPTTYQNYKKATSITVSPAGGVYNIKTNRGHLQINSTILPADAFLTSTSWKLLDNTTVAATKIDGTTTTMLYANGTPTGNGLIRVVGYVNDGSMVSDTITIAINWQGGIMGVDDINNDQIQIFPVPANDYLKVQFPNELFGNVTIMDLNGRTMFVQPTKNREVTIDVRTLKQGVYVIRLDYGTGSKVMKFVKQ